MARGVLARAVLVGLGALAAPGPAAAHDGQPALIAEQNVAPPGGSVVVRGEDLGGEAVIRLTLAGGVGVDLGTFPTDADGHIVLAVAIPQDLLPGEYELRGTIESGAVVRVPIRVDGAAVDAGPALGGQGSRDEDDPLLVALPEGWQQSLSSPAAVAPPSPAAASPAAAPAPVEPAGSLTPLVPLAAASLILIGAAGAALRRLPRRS